MSCPQLVGAFPRISARRGHVVDLNVEFHNNGVLADPFAIRFIEIFKTQVVPHNLVAVIPVVLPTDSLYPAPVCRELITTEAGQCGTEPIPLTPVVGKYHLPYLIPNDAQVPDVYFDVWHFFATDPCGQLGTVGTECNIDDPIYDPLQLKACHRFWVYPDEWFTDDRLQTLRFAFEPLDQRFHYPEIRTLEIGLMPLPLYDYNFNLVNPIIPFLQPTISVETQQHELLIDNAVCRIGLRQGSFRANPYVVQYDLNTTEFLKGTYQYQITLRLPNGLTITSRRFIFTVS